MNKEFVPYDIALAMKELGFDEECTAVYFGEYEERDFDNGIALEYRQSQYYAQKGWSKGLLAPLYQQAFEWFREEYDLWIEISKPLSWLLTISDKTQNKKMCLEDYNEYVEPKSYQEAQDACLRKLIEIVKEKRDEKRSKST